MTVGTASGASTHLSPLCLPWNCSGAYVLRYCREERGLSRGVATIMNNYEHLSGPYRPSAVDWIEQNVVTDEMIDEAFARRAYSHNRSQTRRAIAIGIRAGSYRSWPREKQGIFIYRSTSSA